MRNRAWVSNWCYEKGEAEGVIRKYVREGKTYVDVMDYERLRELFGELLREVQSSTPYHTITSFVFNSDSCVASCFKQQLTITCRVLGR